jgi:hypothetical protein
MRSTGVEHERVSEKAAGQRAVQLMRLVEDRLPVEHTGIRDEEAWPLVGVALLSRMTTTLRHIIALQPLGRGADAGTLVRSLYEHLVHFAWLAADPGPERLQEWRKDDLVSRRKADNDARPLGVELFTDEAREQLDKQIEALAGDPLVLVNLADAADRAWAGKLDATRLGPSS